MSSLPLFPSQHAFKASNKLLLASRPSKGSNDPDFRTSNPTIFPSLSPFSNFYKNKKQSEATAPCRRCPDSSLEPVKKCKLNNGHCKVVPQENVTSNEMITSVPILPKVVADSDSFRVPRLPKRLCEKNGTSTSQIGSFNNNCGFGLALADSQESSILKDSLKQDSEVKQESLSELSIRAQPADDNDIFNQEATKKIDKKALNKDQNGTFSPVMDTSFLTGLYEKLRLEYLLLQYNEQINGKERTIQQDVQEEKQGTKINFDDLVTLSKNLFREHVKKEEVNC